MIPVAISPETVTPVILKAERAGSVPIHPELRVDLERLSQTGQSGFVFRALRGGPLHPRNVLQEFIDNVIEPLKNRDICEDGEAGFGAGRLHGLRHFFCSLCANQGVPERVLMNWLGHTSSAMVKRYYHLYNDEAQLQMRKLGESKTSA